MLINLIWNLLRDKFKSHVIRFDFVFYLFSSTPFFSMSFINLNSTSNSSAGLFFIMFDYIFNEHFFIYSSNVFGFQNKLNFFSMLTAQLRFYFILRSIFSSFRSYIIIKHIQYTRNFHLIFPKCFGLIYYIIHIQFKFSIV